MTDATISILEAANDPELFESWFRDPTTWRAWFVFLCSMFGLPMSEEDWTLFRQCTGCDDRPTGGFTEAWLVVGRRGGKPDKHLFALRSIDQSINAISSVQKRASSPDLGAAKKGESLVKPWNASLGQSQKSV